MRVPVIVVVGVLSLLALGGRGVFAPAAFALEDEFGGLPSGPGREAVFYLCSACHSIMLVKQQRLTRDDWDEALHYMVEEHEMAEPEGDDRRVLLDYLGTYLGRYVPR